MTLLWIRWGYNSTNLPMIIRITSTFTTWVGGCECDPFWGLKKLHRKSLVNPTKFQWMRHRFFITGFVVEQTSLIKYVPSTKSYLVVWGPVVWDPRTWKGLLLGDQTTGPQTTNLPLVDSNEIAKNDGKNVRNLLKWNSQKTRSKFRHLLAEWLV